MSIKNVIVVANGELPSKTRLLAAISDADFVLAADGGADALLGLGITPNVVLGDFDSLTGPLPASVSRVPAPDQNCTDLDKAVSYLVGLGAGSITLTGVTGGRLDHTFGSLAVLAKYGRQVDLRLFDEYGVALLVNKELEILTKPGQTISLLPMGAVENVATTGLKWNISGESMVIGKRDGTSNIATCNRVTISVGVGDLVVYIHHPS